MLNNIHNASNPHQGSYKHVLTVCSDGLLRSPTTALVLLQGPYNFNTRAAGIDSGHALIAVNIILLSWANEITIGSFKSAEVCRCMIKTTGKLTYKEIK